MEEMLCFWSQVELLLGKTVVKMHKREVKVKVKVQVRCKLELIKSKMLLASFLQFRTWTSVCEVVEVLCVLKWHSILLLDSNA